jgi:hypothetical protein
MTGYLLAQTDLGWGENVIRVLAVVGAAVLGGLAFAWLVGLIVKVATTRIPPRWATLGLRLGGGLICGWLVYLVAFGGGGTGLGGTGGWLGGSGGPGKGNDSRAEVSPDKVKKNKDDKSKDDKGKEEKKDPSGPGKEDASNATVEVEVLGNDDLQKILKSRSIDRERRYRLGPGRLKIARELHTLSEAKQKLRELFATRPELKSIEIVLYRDSPTKNGPEVAALQGWAGQDLLVKGAKVRVDLVERDKTAPLD